MESNLHLHFINYFKQNCTYVRGFLTHAQSRYGSVLTTDSVSMFQRYSPLAKKCKAGIRRSFWLEACSSLAQAPGHHEQKMMQAHELTVDRASWFASIPDPAEEASTCLFLYNPIPWKLATTQVPGFRSQAILLQVAN